MYVTDNTIMDMAIHDGALWVGTGYNGLAKITDGHIEKFNMRNAGFSSTQNICSIYLLSGYNLTPYFERFGFLRVKYMVHNDEEGRDYCTGFAFEGEFVADFPYCPKRLCNEWGRILFAILSVGS